MISTSKNFGRIVAGFERNSDDKMATLCRRLQTVVNVITVNNCHCKHFVCVAKVRVTLS